jgi:hypothetical protein
MCDVTGSPETESMYSPTANASFTMHFCGGVRFELQAGSHDQVLREPEAFHPVYAL